MIYRNHYPSIAAYLFNVLKNLGKLLDALAFLLTFGFLSTDIELTIDCQRQEIESNRAQNDDTGIFPTTWWGEILLFFALFAISVAILLLLKNPK